jgi:arylsulfatase A-like enzyme
MLKSKPLLRTSSLKNMQRYLISLLFLFLSYGLSVADNRPNLIKIFVDDLGWGDPVCYGGDLVPTPAMDKLAQEGVLATAGYVTSPVCGPSRYGLMAGAYQQRFGVQTNRDAFSNMPGDRVPRSHLLMPEHLRQAGYVTGLVGKWNLKSDARIWFDEVYSLMDWGADYFPDENGVYPGVWQRWPYDKPSKDYGWGPEREGDEYLTDRLGRESVEFIEQYADQPFFLYLAFNAPHSPLQAKKEHKPMVAHIESEPLQLYAAMVISIDENIARIMDALERLGISDNTFVIFSSDNGPSYAYNVGWPEHWERVMLGSAGEFSGRKARLHEGGVRVPYILRWPGVLEAGKVYDEPVSTLDVYPTFAAAANAPIREGTHLDGVNLLPYLKDEKTGSPHERLYWYQSGRGAVLEAPWKLLIDSPSQPPALYNLEEDPAELNNLSSAHPDLYERMLGAWRDFVDTMPPTFDEQYNAARDRFLDAERSMPRAIHDPQPSARQTEQEQERVSVTPATEAKTLTAAIASYVRLGSPANDTRDEQRILVGHHNGARFGNMRGLIEFDLGNVPGNAVISSARLRLSPAEDGNGFTGPVSDLLILDQRLPHGTLDSMRNISWNSTNGGNPDGRVVGRLKANDRGAFAQEGSIELERDDALVDAVQNALRREQRLTLLLIAPDSENSGDHRFWRIGSESDSAPVLELAY